MKKALTIAAVLLAVPAAAEQWAAIAAHDTTREPGGGDFIYGAVWGRATRADAIREAMKLCVEKGGLDDAQRADTDEYGYADNQFTCSIHPGNLLRLDDTAPPISRIPGMASTECVAWREDTNWRGEVSYWSGMGPDRAWLEQKMIAEFKSWTNPPGKVELVALVCGNDPPLSN